MRSPTTRIPAYAGNAPVFEGAGLSHRGTVREANEDSILTDPTGQLWAVADGMGGYGHGDLASDLVINALAEIDDTVPATQALSAALRRANTDIQAHATARGIGPIGATVVAMMLDASVAHVVWAGDCRAYLMRNRSLKLLTRDHTVVQDMVDQGLLRPDSRETHPEAHVVTRAVGYEAEIELDALTVPVVPGDILVMCSDGLTGCLGDHEIADHMAAAVDPDALCKALMTSALTRGASDNVSVVAVFACEGL
jgi:protein phosphatase